MRQAVAEATEDSPRTASFVIWRTGQIVRQHRHRRAGGRLAVAAQPLPVVRQGVGGEAPDRLGEHPPVPGRRPEGMFAARTVSAPGELMEIDSTPLDVMVLLDDGMSAGST